MKTTIPALLIALMSTSALADTTVRETKSKPSPGFTCSMDIEDSELRPCNKKQRAFADRIRENLSIIPHIKTRDGLAIVPHLVPSDGLSIIPHLTVDEAYGMCMTDGIVIFDGFLFSYNAAPSTGRCAKWAWALTDADREIAKKAPSEK